jgi:hypothetical protein
MRSVRAGDGMARDPFGYGRNNVDAPIIAPLEPIASGSGRVHLDPVCKGDHCAHRGSFRNYPSQACWTLAQASTIWSMSSSDPSSTVCVSHTVCPGVLRVRHLGQVRQGFLAKPIAERALDCVLVRQRHIPAAARNPFRL